MGKPLVRIAEEFNTDPAAIVDACERMSVPRPSAGHWSRPALGKSEPQPPSGRRRARRKS